MGLYPSTFISSEVLHPLVARQKAAQGIVGQPLQPQHQEHQ
jgi:hypothetical protein